MIEFKGQCNIVARIIADSISEDGVRLTTYELEYPRFIHAEFMTHRALSKNSASSRAIPAKKMREHIKSVLQAPVSWGKNEPGMQAKEELSGVFLASAQSIWDAARNAALSFHAAMEATSAHKQVVNRLTEPFMQMKVVCSGTEWENFFWLRDHPDADPTIRELAHCMRLCRENSKPTDLFLGEWHLPYIDSVLGDYILTYKTSDGQIIDLETAKKVSASCCAQVSYRVLDDSVDKALMIFDKLINSVPVHASPVEHQATPIDPNMMETHVMEWADHGVTHMDNQYNLWSGNFRGWVQHRQLIQGHTKW